MECKQMDMPDMLRYLKGETRKGTSWLPLEDRLNGCEYILDEGKIMYGLIPPLPHIHQACSALHNST